MLANNQPWQAIVNKDNVSKAIASVSHLSAVKQTQSSANEVKGYTMKILTAKRYSFDDNGGGYQGL